MAAGKTGASTGRIETWYLVQCTGRLRYIGELPLTIKGATMKRADMGNGKLALYRSASQAKARAVELSAKLGKVELRLLQREPTKTELKANSL